MKRSIKHLPKRTQEEVNTLLELITRQVPGCVMVVLFGSYARGGYVLWDEYVEDGVRYSYQSDLDILVVTSRTNVQLAEVKLRKKVTEQYNKLFKHRRHATPQFIVEDVTRLNKELTKGGYFYSDIVKEGIRIYDDKTYALAKPRALSVQEIRDIAVEELGKCYPFAVEFLETAQHNLSQDQYKMGAFLLHQACERFYHAISLVYTNYRLQSHNLEILSARVKEFSRDLTTVFPETTGTQETCYDLLCRAYIEARYNKHYTVTKTQLEYMIARTELLREITHRICTDKINSYNTLIENQKNSIR